MGVFSQALTRNTPRLCSQLSNKSCSTEFVAIKHLTNSVVDTAARKTKEMDFDAVYSTEVLKPNSLIPMKQEPPEEDVDSVWTDVHDVNTAVKHLDVTTEEDGELLTIFVEGNVETINAEENVDRLALKIPRKVLNCVFKKIEMMTGTTMELFDEETVILEQEIQGYEKTRIPFSFTLYYKIA